MTAKPSSRPTTSDTTLRGFGLGLRPQHYEEILACAPAVDWFEILSENYLVDGGKPLYYLDRIRERYPLVMHGVSLSIGGTDPLDRDYLRQLKKLADRVRPRLISDHLCWTGVDGVQLHDLMPLPQTDESVRHIAERVRQVQDILGRPLILENVSSYLRFAHSTLSECEFLYELVAEAGCGLLLDVNNIYVNSRNHGFDAAAFIDHLPQGCVHQIHLAGHSANGDLLIDTHDQPVPEPVWQLYAHAVDRFGNVPTMIERDDHIPPFTELVDELQRARQIAAAHLAVAA